MSARWLNFREAIFHLLQNTISLVQLQKVYKPLLVIPDVAPLCLLMWSFQALSVRLWSTLLSPQLSAAQCHTARLRHSQAPATGGLRATQFITTMSKSKQF